MTTKLHKIENEYNAYRFHGPAPESVDLRFLCQMNRKRGGARYVSTKTSAKATLLPPTLEAVRSLSLRNHLALTALRAGSGNGHLLSDLIRALYLAWYLREAGFGTIHHASFPEAAEALERSAARATANNVWQVSPDEAAILERLLALHDEQLANTPVGVMLGAQRRLLRFATSDRKTPWQEAGR
ncbi:hypothetical protein PQQ86_00165 [Paraburkholderia sediminicola]|uniref:hypothetical protein n=1 Tax=Paraburkholderia TaxID=1822464 RepID=UPI0038B737C9